MSERRDEFTKRQRVRVTDRRRVRPDEPGAPDAAVGAEDAGTAAGEVRRPEQGARPDVGAQAAAPRDVAQGPSAPAAKVPESPAGGAGAEDGPTGGAQDGAADGAADSAELEAARREAAEFRGHLQRLQAEFENYRKRVLKEQTRAVDMAAEPLVRKLLEVLDEFDLALMAAEKRPDFDRFLHGVELVYAKLTDILRTEGLERIEARGRPFDPSLHEALMQSGDQDGEPYCADVLRPGYTLKGRVIRPAGVKVTHRQE